MKNQINLNHLREIEEKLRKQADGLSLLCEEVSRAQERVKELSYMDASRHALAQTGEALRENIRVLNQMAAAVREAAAQYERAERKITDRYNLDTVVYPQTQFSVSYITGLDEYRMLMPF